MALTSTLFTGLSELDANTTRLTVVGNNIANANTVAFKASRAFLQGYGVDTNFKIVPGKLQNLKVPLGAASTAEATKVMGMSGNLDAGGNPATGASILTSQVLTRVGGASAPSGSTLLTDVA